jgi:hypothetical protein
VSAALPTPSVADDHHDDLPSHCPNCAAELHGPWCHACGQKATSHLGFHDFVHEATHEFLHLDGKIVTTLKHLVFKPGQLTKDFLAGRRARFITPLRLYLTFSVLFFALTAIVPGARDSMVRVSETNETVAPVVVQSGGPRGTSLAPDRGMADRLGNSIMSNLPRAMFVLMPIFALLTWLLFRREQPFYIPHLYYSIHFHAFTFFALSITALCGAAGSIGKMVASAVFLTTVPWHYAGLRRVYGNSWPKTILKGTVLAALYWILIAAAMLAIVTLTLRAAKP